MSATRDRLLDAAETEMRLRGYHAVSFRDLAASLGIKSASVHYYFRQKEDLGIALVERYAERFFEALSDRTAGADNDPRLPAFVAVYRDALLSADSMCLCGMLGAESQGLPEAVAEKTAQFFRRNIYWVGEALPRDLSDEDRQQRAEHIVGALQGAMMLAKTLKNSAVFDRIAEDLLRVDAR
jgi:TetR/AcrR family transcriptional repressor of nem operon